MKIAISVRGDGLESPVDPRFGRALRFLVVDPDTKAFEVVANEQNLRAAQGAGVQAAETVSRHGATVLLTGHCGPKAFRVLQAAGIAVLTGASGTAAEALEAFLKGRLKALEAPDVSGHWA